MSDKSPEQIAHNARAVRLRFIRQLHFWVAVFVAPSLLLFAMTGMLQLFGLHEAEGGYKPLPVIEKLGQVHIHQKFALRPVRARPPQAAALATAKPVIVKPEAEEEGAPLGETLVKWAFLVMAAGMALSSILGIWMALSNTRQRPIALALLAAGTVLPILALAL